MHRREGIREDGGQVTAFCVVLNSVKEQPQILRLRFAQDDTGWGGFVLCQSEKRDPSHLFIPSVNKLTSLFT